MLFKVIIFFLMITNETMVLEISSDTNVIDSIEECHRTANAAITTFMHHDPRAALVKQIKYACVNDKHDQQL